MARNIPAESSLGVNLATVFWFHNLTSLGFTLYGASFSLFGSGKSNQFYFLDCVMGFLYLFWLLCGTIALRKLWTKRARYVE